jgi:hypothetical protein
MSESDIKYETRGFFVLDVGAKGFEVLENRGTHSVRVASIGAGPGPALGVERAIAEADRRQAAADKAVTVERDAAEFFQAEQCPSDRAFR